MSSIKCVWVVGILAATTVAQGPGALFVRRSAFVIDDLAIETGFATAVASPGDVNGNGSEDLAISSPSLGSGPQSALEVRDGFDGATIWRIASAPGEHLGAGLLATDDLDGDGIMDVAAATLVPDAATPWFRPSVRFFSGATGASLSEALIPILHPLASRLSLALMDDRTGDGVREVALGGTADVGQTCPLPVGGLLSAFTASLHVIDPAAAVLVGGGSVGLPCLGTGFTVVSLLGGRDVTGDGVADLLVGASGSVGPFPANVGGVLVVSGFDLSVVRIIAGSDSQLRFGTALAWTPDFTGDGVPELAVGAPSQSVAIPAGRVLLVDPTSGVTLLGFESPVANLARFGLSVAVQPGATAQLTALVISGSPVPGIAPLLNATVAVQLEFGLTQAVPLFLFRYELPWDRLTSAGVHAMVVGDTNGDGSVDLLLTNPGGISDPGSAALVRRATASTFDSSSGPSALALEPFGGFPFFAGVRLVGGAFALPATVAFLIGTEADDAPFDGGALLVDLPGAVICVLPATLPDTVLGVTSTAQAGLGLQNLEFVVQAGVIDPNVPAGVLLSNGVRLTL